MNSTLYALALLTPYDIDAPKIRIGPKADGGYVFVDDISPEQTILSYGISTEYRFDEEMAHRGHAVYMFDHTIQGINATSANMLWFQEGVGKETTSEKKIFSIEDHLASHNITGDRLILKIDVEGAEFDALDGLSDASLSRFEQIVLEIHGLSQLLNPAYLVPYMKMLRKINKQFTLFHVHGNNCDGPNGIEVVDGFPVSSLMELSYIKTKKVRRSQSRTLYPTALDYPNVGRKDKLLWFFPFLPSETSLLEYALCEQRIEMFEEMRAAGLR